MGEASEGWAFWEEARQPGDYMVVHSGEAKFLYVCFPDGFVGNCATPNHTFTEHGDGTVTVDPSILATLADHGHDWHGYLERGVWREV